MTTDRILVADGPYKGHQVSSQLGERWPYCVWFYPPVGLIAWYTLYRGKYYDTGEREEFTLTNEGMTWRKIES